jgi:hypothetical protein
MVLAVGLIGWLAAAAVTFTGPLLSPARDAGAAALAIVHAVHALHDSISSPRPRPS